MRSIPKEPIAGKNVHDRTVPGVSESVGKSVGVPRRRDSRVY
jgi:hypothetical protein